MRTVKLRVVSAVLVGGLAFAAVACGSDDNGSGGGSDDTTGATSGTDAPDVTSSGTDSVSETTDGPAMAGGELRVVLGTEPTTLNPLIGVRSDQIVGVSMVEQYVRLDENGDPTDWSLVEEIERVDDATWRFTLREGIVFSNGEPLDAEAAAWATLTHRDQAAGILAGFFAVIEDAVAVDERTWEVTTSISTNAIPALFTNLYAFPPAYYEEVGPEEFGRAPVGTGAFVLDQWDVGTSISVVSNPDYWRGTPSLDGISWSFAGEADTRIGLLQTGDADVVNNVPVNAQDEVDSADDLRLESVQSISQMTVFLVKEAGPLADPILREAAARAIDKDVLVDVIMGGEGVGAAKLDSFFGSIFNLGSDIEVGYDPELAAQLVEESGVSPDVTFTFTSGRYTSDTELGEAVAGMLEAAGFNVTRNVLEPASFFPAVIGQELDGLYMFGVVPVYPHEDVVARGFLTDPSITGTCNDPRFNTLADEGLAATTADERKAIYSDMESIALDELTCFAPLFVYINTYGVSESVQGFTPAFDDLHDYFQVSMQS